jgi:class 3 adenylate cyclase/tetratricopeptide (TPR) repeat protein
VEDSGVPTSATPTQGLTAVAVAPSARPLPTGVVTFLLTDIVGSTRLWEAAPAAMADALPRHDALISDSVTRHGGTVLKPRGEGDSTFSVFQRAGDAAAAALGAQEALAREPWPPHAPVRVRMAIHRGETLEQGGDYYGREVNRAARLRNIAQETQVLVTEAVAEAIRAELPEDVELITLGSWLLRDVSRPEHVYRLQRRRPVIPRGGLRTEGAPTPLPTRLAQLPASGFVGRSRELDVLWRGVTQVAAGARRVALLSGEAGIGKTRLAAEIARRAHGSGTTVLYGRCEEDLGVPYQPFIEALRHYVEHAPQPVLDAVAARHGGHLVRLVPQLAQRAAGLPVASASDPETDRYLMFDAVVGLMAAASADAPLLLVLDDVHWADRNALLLLRHVVEAADPMRLLVVATYRESDILSGHPLADVVGAMGREATVDRLGLTGLNEQEVVAFVAERAQQNLDERLVALAQWLWNETDGNPFFVHESLRHLVDMHALRRVDGQWVLAAELSDLRPPDSVREVVSLRVAHLGELAERALTTAAVIGRVFDVDLLAAVLGVPEDDVLTTLERAVGARLLTEGGTPGHFAFSHALVVHSLYEALGLTRRSRVHRRVAETLEALCGDNPGERLPELATHWLAAGLPSEANRTIGYVRRAGDQALEHLAPDEAARWYEHALALVGETTAGEPARCELLIALGVAQRQAGDDRFRTTLLEAGSLAQRLGDTDALVQAALANNRGDVSTAGQVDTDRLATLERALATIDPADSPARARLLATLALESTYAGDWERRQALSDEALEIARRLGDPVTLAAVLTVRHEAIRLPHTLPERLANTAEHLEVADRLGDPLQRAFAAHWRIRACWETGDIGEIDRCMAVVDELGGLNQYLRWNASAQWSYRLLIQGRIDEAEQRAYEAFGIGQAAGQPDAPAVLAAQLVNIRWDQGRLGELEPMLQQAVVDNPGIPAFRAVLTQAYCELDRFADARALFERDVASAFADYPYDAVWLCSFVLLADVCAQLGDSDRAPGLYERLAPWRDQVVFSGASVYGSVAHYLGQLAAAGARYDDAERHFGAAAARHEEMGAVTFLARTRLSWALMLAARGGPGDQERAEAMAGEAQAGASRVGAATIERRAGTLLEKLRSADGC